jgi:hypothetical protein
VKTSQNAASFRAATSGIISSMISLIYPSRSFANSGGKAWAPRKVAMSVGASCSSRTVIASRSFNSLSVSSPYPLFTSIVVEPCAKALRISGRTRSTISSSDAARTDFIELRMPPPAS